MIRSFDDLARAYAEAVDRFFFIQVGANDGKSGDPLFPLIREFGWRGVLIEPQRRVYETLLARHPDSPGLAFENVAIAEEEGVRDLFVIAFSNERWATGLASLDRRHLERHLRNGYVRRRAAGALPDRAADCITTQRVRTTTFDALLDKHRPEKIHLLQIDAEGYDHHLLRLFDFGRFRPALVQFEQHVMDADQRESSLRLIGERGYVSFSCGVNVAAVQAPIAWALGLEFEVRNLRRPGPAR